MSEVVKLRESLAQTAAQQQDMERGREEVEHTISQVSPAKEGTMKGRYRRGGCLVLPQSPSLAFTPAARRRHSLCCVFLWLVLTRAV